MSDDLISRQAAIDELEERIHSNDYSDVALVSELNRSIGYLMRLPSVQQWTPVSERLPDVNGRYLVTRGLNACGAMWNRVYLINYSDLMGLKSERIWWNGNVGKSDFESIDDVTAWMPLPEPYKEEDDGEIH